MKKIISIATLILFIPSLVLNVFLLLRTNTTLDKGVKVIEVIDGDTFLLDNKTRLRLRHIDAPELNFCGGPQAKNFLIDLVKNKQVIISEQIPDQYGRAMALVTLGNVLINEKLLESGWVRYHSDVSSKEKVLKEVASRAKEEKKGIYSSLCLEDKNTKNPNCLIKGNIDKNSTSRKYYLPNCAQYKFTLVEKDLGEDWFCTESQAQKAGFTKADTCR